MGVACGDRVKTIKTILVAEKFNFFGKKVFSGERFRIKESFYTSFKIAISVQNPMLKMNYLLHLTRALLGGAFKRPLRFFEDSENTAARSAARFSPTLPPCFPQLL